MRRSLLALALLTLAAAPVMAQETGTPAFLGPDRLFTNSAFGATFSDPGGGFALEGYYRKAVNPESDFGVRVGFSEPDGNGNTAFLLGGDYRVHLLTHTEDFPLDGSLVVGVGASLADGANALFVPVGFSMGRKILLENSTTSFVPYINPTFIPVFADDSDIEFAVGLGVDMKFGEKFDLNISGSFGDLDGISASFSWLH